MNASNGASMIVKQLSVCRRCLHLCVKSHMRKKGPPPKNFVTFPVQGTMEYVQRHLKDPYVKLRHYQGYRCRSVYKLFEIDDKENILKPGMSVIDLGAAPGSWSQGAAERIFTVDEMDIEVSSKNSNNNWDDGIIISVDLKKFPPMDNVHQIVGDFTLLETQQEILKILKEKRQTTNVDLVMCDAAPNATGIKQHNHQVIVSLAASAWKFTTKVLRPGGIFLFKLWDGTETSNMKKTLSKYFAAVKIIKPPASRSDSAEIFVLCKHMKKIS